MTMENCHKCGRPVLSRLLWIGPLSISLSPFTVRWWRDGGSRNPRGLVACTYDARAESMTCGRRGCRSAKLKRFQVQPLPTRVVTDANGNVTKFYERPGDAELVTPKETRG